MWTETIARSGEGYLTPLIKTHIAMISGIRGKICTTFLPLLFMRDGSWQSYNIHCGLVRVEWESIQVIKNSKNGVETRRTDFSLPSKSIFYLGSIKTDTSFSIFSTHRWAISIQKMLEVIFQTSIEKNIKYEEDGTRYYLRTGELFSLFLLSLQCLLIWTGHGITDGQVVCSLFCSLLTMCINIGWTDRLVIFVQKKFISEKKTSININGIEKKKKLRKKDVSNQYR